MSIRFRTRYSLRFALRCGCRFLRDGRGAAAIEFAFVAPILLSMYFITMEAAQGIEANKKVGRVASTVADLVTQQDEVTTADLDAILTIGETVIRPYNRSAPDIILTAITISSDAPPEATVAWSRQMVGGKPGPGVGLAKGTPVEVPDDLRVADSFLIRAETKLDYNPIIGWSSTHGGSIGIMDAFSKINMSETYYLRPRISTTIDCDDC